MKSKTNSTFWICLLLLALLARVSVAFYWESRLKSETLTSTSTTMPPNSASRFFFGDSDSYWKLGQAIAFNRPYEFDEERHWQIFRTPGYPAILAPLFVLYGENLPTIAARLQGALFGTLNVALVGLLAWKLLIFPARPRIWIVRLSSVFVAFDPTLILQSILILSEESFLTFALLQNLLILSLARKLGLLPFPSRDNAAFRKEAVYLDWQPPRKLSWLNLFGTALLLGLTTAMTIYIRPSWYYYLPFATVVIVAFRCFTGNVHETEDYHYTQYEIIFSWRKLIFTSITVIIFVFAALGPWIARNYELTRQSVPTSLQLGASLYDGLNPSATGASNMDFVDHFRQAEMANPSDSLDVHFEVRLDNRMKRAAIDWVKSDPQKALKLAFIKIYRLWAPIPREKAFATPFLKLCLVASFVPIFLLGLAGGIKSFRKRGAAWTLLIPAFYITILHSIFVSSIRYRTPVLYGFSILAAFFILCSFDSLSGIFNNKTRLTTTENKTSSETNEFKRI